MKKVARELNALYTQNQDLHQMNRYYKHELKKLQQRE